MSNTPPPPGGPKPERPAGSRRASQPRAAGAVASGKIPAKGTGSGRKGKVKLRDVHGKARAKFVARKTGKWVGIFAVVFALLGAGTVYVTYRMIDIPDPNSAFEAQTTTVYYSDGKHVLGRFALQNRQSIQLSEMPQSIQDAVISAEDRSFYTNSGLDYKGIVRAAWNNLRSDAVEQGASTITQQYVKILYLSQERTYTRKIKEAFLAVKLQNQLSKDEILEGYLNTIYYGRGAYGIEAASQAYFDKPAKDLTVAESAVLASVLNSPSAFDPANGKDARARLLGRYQYVLDGMVDAGTLDAAQAAKIYDHLPKFPKIPVTNQFGGQKGYMMTLVRQQLLAQGISERDIDGGGLKVVTTFDWKMEQEATQTVREMRPPDRPQLHIALASVEPGTGALRAMIGGRDFLKSQINWALEGGQPGSTFKPFALAAGLKDGFTLQSNFDGNSPYTYPNGETVRNEGESFGVPNGVSYGTVTLLKATEDSINTAYADLTSQMDNGPQKVIKAAAAAGIPKDAPGLEPNLGVALGSATIAPVDMANGYATFAAKGKASELHVIQKISDANGLRWEWQGKPTQAFSGAVSSNVTYALEQVVKSGTGVNAQAVERPAAGKTGTATAVQNDGTQHVSSSWFVGYTPQLSTAVMFVRGNGHQALDDGYLEPFFGGSYPTQTWASYMGKALADEAPLDFPEPAELHGETPTYVPPPPATTTQETKPTKPTKPTEPTKPTTPTTPTAPTTPTGPTAPTTPTGPTGPTTTGPTAPDQPGGQGGPGGPGQPGGGQGQQGKADLVATLPGSGHTRLVARRRIRRPTTVD